MQGSTNDHVYLAQKWNRGNRVATNYDFSNLNDIYHEPDWGDESHLKGWKRGRRIEAWRVQTRDLFWHSITTAEFVRLRGGNETYTD